MSYNFSVDERGFIVVDQHLRSVTDKAVFGGGDCISYLLFPSDFLIIKLIIIS